MIFIFNEYKINLKKNIHNFKTIKTIYIISKLLKFL